MTARILRPSIIIAIFLIASAIGSSPLQYRVCASKPSASESSPGNQASPMQAWIRLETTKGTIRLLIFQGWSPHGFERFLTLVKQNYYDNSPIFRVIAGKWAQFGINGDPKISQAWRARPIPDDPRVESNVRGTVFFAFKDPNGRTTQVVINLRDNSETFDKEPFVPIGKVIEGMNVADALYSDYGEQSGGGIRAGKQDPLFKEGNDYLKRNFPKLDYITKATVKRVVAY
ncbi:MAG TPA: peptidylprolyl isomerase [Pyrinomonadaceae bacterium]|nr:peptidylprolyl isomerase [Pyrinomonadaceae bacterium]